ncbi:MAG TPA: PKD domain-containing protein [Flavipsychrobacter sp.]|nr:PKD domain-containing protein [Flavipsychrobacter sp.]
MKKTLIAKYVIIILSTLIFSKTFAQSCTCSWPGKTLIVNGDFSDPNTLDSSVGFQTDYSDTFDYGYGKIYWTRNVDSVYSAGYHIWTSFGSIPGPGGKGHFLIYDGAAVKSSSPPYPNFAKLPYDVLRYVNIPVIKGIKYNFNYYCNTIDSGVYISAQPTLDILINNDTISSYTTNGDSAGIWHFNSACWVADTNMITIRITDTNKSWFGNDFMIADVAFTPCVYFQSIKDSIKCYTAYFKDSTNSSFRLSYKWSFGDGSTDTGIAVTHTYAANGTYYVTLATMDSVGYADTLYDTVKINVLPMKYAIKDSIYNCTAVQFSASRISGDLASKYTWNFGDGSSGIGNPTNYNYSDTGTYPVILLLLNSQGCPDTLDTSVTIKPAAMNYSIYDSIVKCRRLLFTANSLSSENAVSFTWNFGDSTTGTGNPVTHNYNNSGTYPVSLVATNKNGCTDSFATTVSLSNNINYTIADSAINCIKAMFDAVHINGDTASSYLWSFGDGATDTNYNTTHQYSNTGNYTVSLIVSNKQGCADTANTTINLVHPIPITTSGDTTICQGTTAQLHAYGAATYSWLPPYSLSDPNSADPISTASVTTTYIVTGTDNGGCVGKDSLQVKILPGPTLILNSNGQIISCTNKTVQLFATGAINYSWQPAKYCDDSASSQPIVSPQNTTTFYVTGIGANGCSSKGSIIVDADKQPNVFMPSAFTPNGDGKNDLVYPIIACDFVFESFHIYNRWGQEIFTTKTYMQGWDGRFKGVPCEIGSYYYFVKGHSQEGEELLIKGDIALIR